MNQSLSPEQKLWGAVWQRKSLWGIHFVANAILLALAYQWLWIPDGTVLHLLMSAGAGLLLVLAALWLHGSTLAHFREAHSDNGISFSSALRAFPRKLLAFAGWALLFAVAIAFVFRLELYRQQSSNWMASFLSLRLQRPVTPESISTIFSWALVAVAFVVVPLLLLPLGSRIAAKGFPGFRPSRAKPSGGTFSRVRLWGIYLILLIAGAVIPYQLMGWIPDLGGLYPETASLIIRLLLAYALSVTSWLLLASALGLRGAASEQGLEIRG